MRERKRQSLRVYACVCKRLKQTHYPRAKQRFHKSPLPHFLERQQPLLTALQSRFLFLDLGFEIGFVRSHVFYGRLVLLDFLFASTNGRLHATLYFRQFKLPVDDVSASFLQDFRGGNFQSQKMGKYCGSDFMSPIKENCEG